MDDVQALGGLDHVAQRLGLGQGKGRLLERVFGTTLGKLRQQPTVGAAAAVIRMRRGQLGKVGATAQLAQQILRLGARLRFRLARGGDKDVAHHALFAALVSARRRGAVLRLRQTLGLGIGNRGGLARAANPQVGQRPRRRLLQLTRWLGLAVKAIFARLLRQHALGVNALRQIVDRLSLGKKLGPALWRQQAVHGVLHVLQRYLATRAAHQHRVGRAGRRLRRGGGDRHGRRRGRGRLRLRRGRGAARAQAGGQRRGGQNVQHGPRANVAACRHGVRLGGGQSWLEQNLHGVNGLY